MKKLFLTLCVLLSSKMACALPLGNPQEPNLLVNGIFFTDCFFPNACFSWLNCFHVQAGFYGDYVFNRHLETDEKPHKDIETTRMNTNAGYLALDFFDRVEVFTSLGNTDAHIRTNFSAFSPTAGFSPKGQHIDILTATDFSWSIGARAIVWNWDRLTIGLEGQYFSVDPEVIRVSVATGDAHYPSDVRMQYHEWQVGIGASYNICFVVFPYIGIKWARSHADFHEAVIPFTGGPDETVTLHRLKSEKNVGYAVGLTFVICCRASVTIEGRFADERACFVNGQIQF